MAELEPICASAEHAAIVHYEPTPETDVPLTQNGLFLTDQAEDT